MLRRRMLQALVVLFAIILAAALPVYAADELWYKEYGGNGSDELYDIVQLSDGGFALLGWLENTSSGEWSAWLIRTNSDGEMIWNKTYDTGGFASDIGSEYRRIPHRWTDCWASCMDDSHGCLGGYGLELYIRDGGR
jgi:hypothetical protein